MQPRAVVLFAGGLDSMLAACAAQSSGVDVQLLHFRTPFTTLTARAESSAASLGLPLTILDSDEEYLARITSPRFGRCEVAAPCLDCRDHLFHLAAKALDTYDAHFIVTGEVLGQRRWGQRRRDFEAIAIRTGLEGLIERPLSAMLLEPTLAQKRGWIDDEVLFDIQGKNRRPQLDLAWWFGLKSIPAPLARCCQLADATVGKRVLHTIGQRLPLTTLRCELMTVAAQVRLSNSVEMTLSRNAADGDRIRDIVRRHADESVALLEPISFSGPLAAIQGTLDSAVLVAAVTAMRSRAKHSSEQPAEYQLTQGSHTQRLSL